MRWNVAAASTLVVGVAMAVLVSIQAAFAGGVESRIREAGAVRYVSGGVGADERAALDALGREFNLKVAASATGGAYLGSFRVAIETLRGERVFEVETEGPILLAALPSGTYNLTATAFEQRVRRQVSVRDGRRTLVVLTFRAPDAAGERSGAPPRAQDDEGVSLYSLDPQAAERARRVEQAEVVGE